MKTIHELQTSIETRIKKHFSDITNSPLGLYEPIEYMMQIGGKRLRPALVMMAFNIYNSTPEKAIDQAIALEVFHNFTLVHDDIMDKSDIRRNIPTVHKKWDENRAILSGDAMLIRAYQLLATPENKNLSESLRAFSDIAMKVCEGQQYDMEFETRSDVSIDEYLTMIELKTSVLIAGCLKIGAILGQAPASDTDKLYEFGKNIGIAFQLQDDLLDVYGDMEKFGKKIGNDIITNKKTFLLLKAIEIATGKNAKELCQLINQQDKPEEKIKKVITIYNSLNIKEITEAKISEYFDDAANSLATIEVESAKKIRLQEFANMLIMRDK